MDCLIEAKMIIIRTRMRLRLAVKTKWEIIPIIFVIKIIEIREKEVEEKYLEKYELKN